MSMNGGYKIVNLANVSLTPDTVSTFEGIYAEIEGSYRKPILVSGLVVNEVEYPDMFVTVSHTDTSYVLNLGNNLGTLTITQEDGVTYTVSANA